ncbi:hypothetical protein Atai01_83390 [Amycolatopsis taiwanensis]|uniref:Transposase n=1 Tax=Amycolatopsis taiwanensis TaxID=342230 RepID=A0A9W6VKI3_9PSEU|nr:hypothetical protein Atai01_83390 [Amycolatopsis taiwanensis]
MDAIFYVVDNGITWRALPADFPPWSTVYNHFAAWESAGATQDMLDRLRDRVRLAEGRNAAPSAGSIDSASVKAAETVGATSRGFDAGKKINGRKRHIAVDTLGLLSCVLVTSAGVQDRVAARNLLARLRYICPSIRHLWADSGYTGTLLDWAKSLFGLTIDIVAKLAGQTTFVVLHRRSVVERTLGRPPMAPLSARRSSRNQLYGFTNSILVGQVAVAPRQPIPDDRVELIHGKLTQNTINMRRQHKDFPYHIIIFTWISWIHDLQWVSTLQTLCKQGVSTGKAAAEHFPNQFEFR